MGAEKKKTVLKKEAILDVATRLFLEKGYDATSTNDICNAAHINKPSLYYFFESKRHLFFSCHMRSIQTYLGPYLDQATSIPDPWERLHFIIREFTKMICRYPELKVLIHETMSIKDEYFTKIRTIWKRHYLLLKETISELRTKKVIETDISPSRATLFLLGMMTWMTFWFDPNRKEEIDDMAESALRFALQGLSGKGPALLPPTPEMGHPDKGRPKGA